MFAVPQARNVAVVSVLLLGASAVALGQREGAVLRGVVLRDSTRVPIEGVEIRIEGRGSSLTTAEGTFEFMGVPAGVYAVRLRHPGFRPLESVVRVDPVQVVHRTFEMSALPNELPVVEVRGESRPTSIGMKEFERRKAAGFGKFLSEEEFKNRASTTLTSILRTSVPGMILERLADGRTPAASRRAVQTLSTPSGKCFMQVFVDGQRVYAPSSGRQPPNMDDFLAADLLGVEVYRGAAETPLEFGGPGASCGTIVIWVGRR